MRQLHRISLTLTVLAVSLVHLPAITSPGEAARAADAILHDDLPQLQWFLSHGVDPNATSYGGEPLVYFAAKGHPVALKFLLSRGADATVRFGKGNTALLTAVGVTGIDNTAVITLLLAKGGAKPNAAGPDGSTALHIAIQHGKLAYVRALLSAKADANQKDGQGRTPLELANQQNRDDLVQELVSHGAR